MKALVMKNQQSFEAKSAILIEALANIGVPASHYSIRRHRYNGDRIDLAIIFGDKKVELVFYQAWNVERVERMIRKHVNAVARKYLRESGVDPDAQDASCPENDWRGFPALADASYRNLLLR